MNGRDGRDPDRSHTAEPGGGAFSRDAVPLADKVAFLSSPGAYADAPGAPGAPEVEVTETRMAWVFLAGTRVFKLKKPVRYSYLDYSTPAARRQVCEDEVRLNRRLAPDVYLGVAQLTREADGRLAIDGAGAAVDWLVKMRRLPRERLLDNAIRAKTVSQREIELVADRLTRFYGEAPRVRLDPTDRVAALVDQLDKGREVLANAQFAALAPRGNLVIGRLHRLLDAAPGIVTAPIEAGRIVEGHGDLKPEHVCLSDPPVIIDCLEFSRELRLLDPFDELSYLTMECDVLGARWIGPLLIARCAEGLGEQLDARRLAFYRAYRAVLRARQSLEHLLEPESRTPEKWLPKARGYLAEALRAAVSLGRREARPASHPRADDGSPRQTAVRR